MTRFVGAIALLTLAAAAACSDATGPQPVDQFVARASGSGSGGSVGGGGGGGGSSRPCAVLSMTIFNDVVLGAAVPSFWLPNVGYVAQVSGTTEKSCDLIPNATIRFEDLTGDAGCNVTLSPWVNNPNYLNPKYGAKPMSRYQETFIYYTGTDCIGRSRTLKATLTDPSAGGTISSVTINWTP